MRVNPFIAVSFLSASLMLTGCGSLTGFSNAKSDFGCGDASGEPSCRSISEVYADNRSKLPAAASANTVKPFFEKGSSDSLDALMGSGTKPDAKDFVTMTPAKPWREPETVLRVWLAPFTDKEGDLHDQRFMYVRLSDGGWKTDTVDEMVSVNRLSKPVFPLSPEKEPSAEDLKRQKLKQLPAFGTKNPLPS